MSTDNAVPLENVSRVPQEHGVSARPVPHALASTNVWGCLPLLSVVAACGVFLVSLADTQARMASPWAELLLWVGIMVVFVPIALRLMWSEVTSREGLGLALILGLSLYLVRVLHSPIGFTFTDELLHLRTITDIVQSGHLFHNNPLLRVSPYYPGLEITGTAVATMTGLPVFVSGLLVIAVARIILVLSIYLLIQEITGSSRTASIASVLYMANPNFLYFPAYFSYESLALPLAVAVLFLLVRYSRDHSENRWRILFVALVALAALIPIHHVTPLALCGFLLVWTVAHVVRPILGERWQGTHILIFALLAGGGSALWMTFVARPAVQYLWPQVRVAVQGIARVATRHQGPSHQLFHSAAGLVAPRWVQIVGIAAALFILAVLPWAGGWVVFQRTRVPMALTLALIALAYPLVLVMRFVGGSAWQVANRSSEFIFVPLGFVLAVGVVKFWLPGRFRSLRALTAAIWISVIFLGGTVTSWPYALQLPGSFLLAANERSVVPQGVDAATWSLKYLGSNHVFASDWNSSLLLSSFGRQLTVHPGNGDIDVSYMYFSPQLDKYQVKNLRISGVQYLYVDLRMSRYVPVNGLFDGYDPRAQQFEGTHVPIALLQKFIHTKGIVRVFDSGDIVIYQVRDVGPVR